MADDSLEQPLMSRREAMVRVHGKLASIVDALNVGAELDKTDQDNIRHCHFLVAAVLGYGEFG